MGAIMFVVGEWNLFSSEASRAQHSRSGQSGHPLLAVTPAIFFFDVIVVQFEV